MLNDKQIRALVAEHGATVNQGRSIKQLIEDGEIPRLVGATVLEGKVSDSGKSWSPPTAGNCG